MKQIRPIWISDHLSGASKLASTYFTLFYRSVHVLYTGLCSEIHIHKFVLHCKRNLTNKFVLIR